MHQVQVHIDERWLARGTGNDVLVPNFFEESTGHAQLLFYQHVAVSTKPEASNCLRETTVIFD
jgi:hypothetical protein